MEHHHTCFCCGKDYTHYHDYHDANHAQYRYQCAYPDCRMYYGYRADPTNVRNAKPRVSQSTHNEVFNLPGNVSSPPAILKDKAFRMLAEALAVDRYATILMLPAFGEFRHEERILLTREWQGVVSCVGYFAKIAGAYIEGKEDDVDSNDDGSSTPTMSPDRYDQESKPEWTGSITRSKFISAMQYPSMSDYLNCRDKMLVQSALECNIFGRSNCTPRRNKLTYWKRESREMDGVYYSYSCICNTELYNNSHLPRTIFEKAGEYMSGFHAVPYAVTMFDLDYFVRVRIGVISD